MIGTIENLVTTHPEVALVVGVVSLLAYPAAVLGDKLAGQPRTGEGFGELRTTRLRRLYRHLGLLVLFALTTYGAWRLNLL